MPRTDLEPRHLMQRNVAIWDRALRLGVGIAMLATGWSLGEGVLAVGLRVFAVFPMITAVIGWCPIYALLRIRTCPPSGSAYNRALGTRAGEADTESSGSRAGDRDGRT